MNIQNTGSAVLVGHNLVEDLRSIRDGKDGKTVPVRISILITFTSIIGYAAQ